MSFQGDKLFDPGLLDRLVTLLSPIEVRDAAGGVTTTWSTAGNFYAQFRPQTGREIQQASQKLAEALATFRIRYRAVTARWRVMLESTIYEIIAPPVEVGRKMYYDLVCRAIDPTNLSINGIGIQALTVALSQGDTSKTITYASAFNSIPTSVYAVIVSPNGGFVIDVAVRAGSSLATGFIVDFGADIPASGYSLSIIAVQ